MRDLLKDLAPPVPTGFLAEPPSLFEVGLLLALAAAVAFLARGLVAMNAHQGCGGCAPLSKARSQVKVTFHAMAALAAIGVAIPVISHVAGQ